MGSLDFPVHFCYGYESVACWLLLFMVLVCLDFHHEMRTGKQSHLIFSLMGSWFGCPWKSFSLPKEKILEIEYIEAIVPKREEEPYLHDDWVSSVDGSNDGIWRTAGICTHVLDGHSGPVTSVCILKPKAESVNDQIVATASKDKALRLWKDSFDQPKNVRAFKILRGHAAAVKSIAAEPSGEMVCSGSWDCKINLWITNTSQIEGNMVSLKKRKKNTEDEELQSEGETLSTLVGHTQCVSSVI